MIQLFTWGRFMTIGSLGASAICFGTVMFIGGYPSNEYVTCGILGCTDWGPIWQFQAVGMIAGLIYLSFGMWRLAESRPA